MEKDTQQLEEHCPPELQCLMTEMEKIQSDVLEIKTMNKFILKRFNQLQEREQQKEKQANGDLAGAGFNPEVLIESIIARLEEKDAQHSQKITSLISSVNQIDEKVMSLCTSVKHSEPPWRQTQNVGEDVAAEGNNGHSQAGLVDSTVVDTEQKTPSSTGSTQSQSDPTINISVSSTTSQSSLVSQNTQNITSSATSNIPLKLPPPSQPDQQSGAHSQASLDGMTMIEESDWYMTAQVEAKKGKSLDIPRGKGPSTVFLLDTSASMDGEPLQKMKSFCNRVIMEIEEIAIQDRIEENVAIVTFGQETRIVEHLTNDYDAAKTAIDTLKAGGPSPLMAGLTMCMGAVHGIDPAPYVKSEGCIIPPRIIIISDGHPTDSRYIVDDEDNPHLFNEKEVLQQICGTVERIKSLGHISIYCVPVGNYQMTVLQTIAKLSHGRMISNTEYQSLGRHSINMFKSVALKKLLPKQIMENPQLFGGWMRMSDGSISEGDINDIFHILQSPIIVKDSEADEIGVKGLPNQPVVGTRVERGPDWRWENQDAGGPGTIMGFLKDGRVVVEWDNGNQNYYHYGEDGYDVVVSEKPRLLHDELIAVGCLVQRGKNWRHGNQDGGPGRIGSVFRVRQTGEVAVRWPNGRVDWYKYGCKGFFEVEICDPSNVNYQAMQANATGGFDNENEMAAGATSQRSSNSIYDLAPPPVPKTKLNRKEELLNSEKNISDLNKRNRLSTKTIQDGSEENNSGEITNTAKKGNERKKTEKNNVEESRNIRNIQNLMEKQPEEKDGNNQKEVMVNNLENTENNSGEIINTAKRGNERKKTEKNNVEESRNIRNIQNLSEKQTEEKDGNNQKEVMVNNFENTEKNETLKQNSESVWKSDHDGEQITRKTNEVNITGITEKLENGADRQTLDRVQQANEITGKTNEGNITGITEKLENGADRQTLDRVQQANEITGKTNEGNITGITEKLENSADRQTLDRVQQANEITGKTNEGNITGITEKLENSADRQTLDRVQQANDITGKTYERNITGITEKLENSADRQTLDRVQQANDITGKTYEDDTENLKSDEMKQNQENVMSKNNTEENETHPNVKQNDNSEAREDITRGNNIPDSSVEKKVPLDVNFNNSEISDSGRANQTNSSETVFKPKGDNSFQSDLNLSRGENSKTSDVNSNDHHENFLPGPRKEEVSLTNGIQDDTTIRSSSQNDNYGARLTKLVDDEMHKTVVNSHDLDAFSDTASVISDTSTYIQSCSTWEWKTDGGDWVSYSKEATQKIEKAFRRSKYSTAVVDIRGDLHRVVVSKMMHINIKSRKRAEIRRKEKADIGNLTDVDTDVN